MKDTTEKSEKKVAGSKKPITVIHSDNAQKHKESAKSVAIKFVKSVMKFKNKLSKRASAAFLICISLIILVLLFVIADVASGGEVSAISSSMASVFRKGSAAKFYGTIDADTVFDFKSSYDGYVYLSENGVTYVSDKGDITARQQLTYSKPAIKLSGNKSLIFDRGGDVYSIFSNKSMTTQRNTDDTIIDGDISKRNNYTIAVRDKKSRSILYGFDEKGKVIYQWNCPNGYINNVIINKSGSTVAASIIDSENAVLTSKLYILDFDYETAYATFDFNDEIILKTVFLSDRKVFIVTDKAVYVTAGRDIKLMHEFGSEDIMFCESLDNSYTAVVTRDYSRDDSYRLLVYSKHGNQKGEAILSGKVRALSVSDKSICVLFDHKIETYSGRAKLVGRVLDVNHYDDIVLNGDYAYILSSNSVKKYPVYTFRKESVQEDVSE